MTIPTNLERNVAVVEEVLSAHRFALGADFTGYRNHVYRVLNFCLLLAPDARRSLDLFAAAAVFHDLGIWTDRTFDYLPPSIRLATDHLTRAGQGGRIAEVTTMILEHHKITPYRDAGHPLVEPFRRADWIDVTRGVRRFGLSRPAIASVLGAWPNAGFHGRLVQLGLRRLREHPLSPLPMMRR